MFKFNRLLPFFFALSCLGFAAGASAQLGRAATPAEIQAWNIDVRADFKGLPQGSGSVAKGAEIWEAKCASCHGSFGEANNFVSPVIGGTTLSDTKSGRVARLTDNSYPSRTTMMKVSQLSTLWDYINRAMPWTQPKSMAPDEVYAVVAYMLNTADVVPDNFILSDKNMMATQSLLPNRNGKTTQHALWPGTEFGAISKPDVRAIRCMSNCSETAVVSSKIPAYAMSAHGNLAEQNRLLGPARGQVTEGTQKASQKVSMASVKASDSADMTAITKILSDNSCSACHGMENKLVGPSFKDIAAKYGKKDSTAYLADKIRNGGAGIWGAIPMPAQGIRDEQITILARWLSN